MSDGSFIMEANQASSALTRLGSAYRRNPSLFSIDNYDILTPGKPDMQEYILTYAKYLKGLQGVQVQEGNMQGAVRLGSGMKITTAFVPGPTSLTELDVYIPGNPPALLETVPLTSLCGADDGSPEWDDCIAYASTYYKCQIDEPCISLSYIDRKGKITSTGNGYAVSKGWGYEFGCYFDADLGQPLFDGEPNPCHVFYDETSLEYTIRALLAFLEAVPAAKDYSASEGDALLTHSINTYHYIESQSPPFSLNNSNAAFFGAGLFLLYDYTNEQSYLEEAHSLRSHVSTIFPSDGTRGNEFYWEEYIRHKDALVNAGLSYPVGGKNPEEYFLGQIFFDYKDAGEVSMGNNGERVFEKYRNINFHNSRHILTMGLLASKTAELNSGEDAFVSEVSDNQLSWMTGMNAVQNGVSLSSPLSSRSFIFGIGDFPTQFHSRFLVNTGYKSGSDGEIIGARGTGYMFLDTITHNITPETASNADYQFLDGKASLLGYTLGSLGNKWRGEAYVDPFVRDTPFRNGKTYIPGWINGAFDTTAETDVIFNYVDNLNTYEYTESTDEIVATAIELLAYLDGRQNNKPRHGQSQSGQTFGEENSSVTITTIPGSVHILLNNSAEAYSSQSSILGLLNFPAIVPGLYDLIATKEGYAKYSAAVVINPSEHSLFTVILGQGNSTNATPSNSTTLQNSTTPSSHNASLSITTTPGLVRVFLNNTNHSYIGTSASNGSLAIPSIAPGDWTLVASKNGYSNHSDSFVLSPSEHLSLQIELSPSLGIPNGTNSTNSTNSTLPQNSTSNSAIIITSSTTTLSNAPDMPAGTKYLREDGNGSFSVFLNGSTTVTWFVDGAMMHKKKKKNSTFSWEPGIFSVPRAPDYSTSAISTVTAQTSTQNATWNVMVDNVINPFFSGTDGSGDFVGSADTQIRIFTNNLLVSFSSLNATIQSREGGNNILTFHQLEERANGNETDWHKILTNVPFGDNYLVSITGFDTLSGKVLSYELGTERGHYRSLPQSGESSSSSSRDTQSNSGSGGGAAGLQSTPSLVYVVFGKDVVSVNETQTITLDAKQFNGGIDTVEATFLAPSGSTYTTSLTLMSGTREYGTWSSSFTPAEVGLHTLSSVAMGRQNMKPTSIPVGNRSFYAVGDTVGSNEHLMLVYSVLSKSTVANGTKVTFKIDVRDAEGVVSASAHVKSTKNHDFTFPLKMVGGNKNYGTWEGSFTASEPDTTYRIPSLTLSNSNESKTSAILDRSVYVLAAPPKASATGTIRYTGSPFSLTNIKNLLNMPLVPTIIGFALMIILMGVLLTTQKIGKRFRRQPAE